VDCREIREFLLRGEPERTEALREHLSSCPACNELAAGAGELARELGEGGPLESVPPEVRQKVVASLDAERGVVARLRSLPHWTQVGLVALVALALVGIGGIANLRADMSDYPMPRMVGVVTLLLVFGSVALIHRLRPLYRPPISDKRLDALIALTLVLPAVLALLPTAHTNHPDSVVAEGEFAVKAMTCLTYGSLVSLPLVLLLVAVRRRVATVMSRKLLAAASAAVLGNLVLQFNCPVTMPMHLLVGHAGLVLIFGGVVLARPRR